MSAVLSLCLIVQGDAILVGEDTDPTTGETYYRPLGGHVEFGETPEEAVRRELHEEIDADLCELEFVTSFDNHFTLAGQRRYERVHVFRASLCVPELFRGEEVKLSGPGPPRVLWKPLSDFRVGPSALYPVALRAVLGFPSNRPTT